MMKGSSLSYLPCSQLRGVGKAIQDKLARLGIFTVEDLLFHLPFRYEDRTQITPLAKARVGGKVLIRGELAKVSFPRSGKTRMLCELCDGGRRLHLRFFHIYPLHKKSLELGVQLLCFGELSLGPAGLEMVHPEWQVMRGALPPLESFLTPVYPTTDGLAQNLWRKLMQQALTWLMGEGGLSDLLPKELLQKNAYPSLREALLYIHRPPRDAPLTLLEEKKHVTQKRLVFEELLAHRLALLKFKQALQQCRAEVLANIDDKSARFIQALPFELTEAQKRVMKEIVHDIERPYPMLRLVQGDVGSGKTVVAAFAVLRAIESGCQSVVMAPTELLAEQHYRVFKHWLEPLGLKTVFLSGQLKAKERRQVLADLANGQAQVALGTHALFQKEVVFSKLALIVVDEQHRFGVHQRALLREKGVSEQLVPHQLIMTATPIPRTLAMSMYADLDCSVIDELPRGRLPIQTRVLSNQRREEVLAHVRQACRDGRQAYWVCPLIEESEVLECQAAEKTAQDFEKRLPELKVGLLHGRMKSAEKEQIMLAFKEQKIQLLVATTVIEVGVDVPNASLMIIENAERLGLSQLHQLRGRVGRGELESHCLLLYQNPLSEFAGKRLAAIRGTHDGFKVAEQDLQLRGPGDVLGTRQTGELAFRIAELMRDSDLLPAVAEAATALLLSHPEQVEHLLRRWLHNKGRYQGKRI